MKHKPINLQKIKEIGCMSIIFIIVLAIISIVFLSCSAPEQLTEPDRKDLVIIYTEDNYVFVVPACEIKTIYWPGCDTLKTGNVLLSNR